MPSPNAPRDISSALHDAEDLARQRALALDLRDTRRAHLQNQRRTSMLRRARRAADLMRLADTLAHSGVGQTEFILQPKQGLSKAAPAPTEPATPSARTPSK